MTTVEELLKRHGLAETTIATMRATIALDQWPNEDDGKGPRRRFLATVARLLDATPVGPGPGQEAEVIWVQNVEDARALLGEVLR